MTLDQALERADAVLAAASVVSWAGKTHTAAVTLAREVRRLQAESMRLRGALRKIQNHPTDYMIGTDDNMEMLRSIADAALAGEGRQDGR